MGIFGEPGQGSRRSSGLDPSCRIIRCITVLGNEMAKTCLRATGKVSFATLGTAMENVDSWID